MQTASSTLAAAITSADRPRLLARLLIDWDRDGFGAPGSIDDLSADIASIAIDRSLSTDLPEVVKLFEGYSVAEAVIGLARQTFQPLPSVTTVAYGAPIPYGSADYSYAGIGPPTPSSAPIQHTAWYYSPFNPSSPLFGKRRKGAPARIDIGLAGAAGPEYLTVFTGRVRSLKVNSKDRAVELSLTDLAETMRRQVTLPMVVADGETVASDVSPGLNTTFLADWVARKCGYYASPAPRSTTGVLATMHGSGWPEVGTLAQFRGAGGTMLPFSPTTAASKSAPWVMAVNLNGSGDQLIRYLTAGINNISTRDGDACFFEAWVRFNSISGGTVAGQSIMQSFKTGQQVPYVSLWVDSTGRLQSDFNRGGSDNTNRSTGASGPSGIAANTWYYLACYWAFTSTGVKIWFRVNGTTTGPITVATPSVTNSPFMNTLDVGDGPASSFTTSYLNGLIAEVQFTPENTGSSSPPAFNDAFTPTAQIMADEPNLVATPPTRDEGWQILQQLAAAEFATVGFNELGLFQYLTRQRWKQAPWTQVQRTLDAVKALKDLSSTEALDQIRNHVIVKAVVPKVLDSGQIWDAPARYQIPGGASKTVLMELAGPCANIDTVFNYSGDPAVGSRYLAGTARNGTGAQVSNLQFQTTVISPTLVKVVIVNPNSFTVWLTVDAGAPGFADPTVRGRYVGRAYLILHGQRVMFEAALASEPGTGGASLIRSEASDPASITAHGEQLLELDDNPFRQDPDQIDRLAQDLLAQTRDPKPALHDVPIVGDPRLQLGDRDTLQDPGGLQLNQDFHLSSVHTDLTLGKDGTLSQTISTRAA